MVVAAGELDVLDDPGGDERVHDLLRALLGDAMAAAEGELGLDRKSVV